MTETRLFVGNLPDNTDEHDLRSAFSAYGDVTKIDLKSKPTPASDKNKFAFVSLSASNSNIESCIRYFTTEKFKGCSLYVTRARESFLERLQREREQAQRKKGDRDAKNEHVSIKNPILKLSDKLNPRKRKYENNVNGHHQDEPKAPKVHQNLEVNNADAGDKEIRNKNKYESDKKRLESMKKKREEFNKKQNILKNAFIGVDKVQNKKKVFLDSEDIQNDKSLKSKNMTEIGNKNKIDTLFDGEDESDNEVNFNIKEQFEGTKGQKVLDLQSRYKSDKRFILDERFIEEEHSEEEKDKEQLDEGIDLGQTDEKAKQLNILQDVLGVTIKTRSEPSKDKKVKSKLGMLRFDPSQPEHAKFLAPVEEIDKPPQKNKKKRQKEIQEREKSPEIQDERVEVSKEQFYKVSDTLKEAIAKPNEFSLRRLFSKNEEDTDKVSQIDQDTGYIPLETTKAPKVKNPLDPGEKNPFMYDSSDSEDEEAKKDPKHKTVPEKKEITAVWKEKFFFTEFDQRLKDGLAFFSQIKETDGNKERRELKSLMKKRIYNSERKNQMFQKKIGGKKKTGKKNFRQRIDFRNT